MDLSLRSRLFGRALQLISLLAKKTARLHVSGIEHMQAARVGGRPILWSMWHGQTMLAVNLYLQPQWRRQTGIGESLVMIPDDWRGETLYVWLEAIGVRPYPMDLESKDMKSARQFARLVRTIKAEQFDSFIAPDGPSGPSYEVKPGLAFLSQRGDLPIVPIGSYGRAVYEVNRWDSYALPLPFCHIHMVIGEPLHLPAEAAEAEQAALIQTALNRVTLQAKASYYAAKGH